MTFLKIDYKIMSLAIKLAQKGKYHTQPNPMVGCVITDHDHNILATGYHKKYGGDHAEIVALKNLANNKNATIAYITLEPCCYHGKTPACTDALIKSNIKTVIIASLDSNPKVSGMGVKELKKNSIKVSHGLMQQEENRLNKAFVKAHNTQTPFVVAKIAMSLDGKTATSSGQSKWITSKHSRLDGQKLRMQADAILTGSGTVIADNPNMTVRLDGVSRQPIRLVIDSDNKVSRRANIFNSLAETRHFTKYNAPIKNGKIDLKKLLQNLYQDNINHILLEAGANLVGIMLKMGLIDELVIYTSPIIMGKNSKSAFGLNIVNLNDAVKLDINNIVIIGNDLKIIATPKYLANNVIKL